MSASREKKQRQSDPDQGLTQKQRKELQEKQAAKRKAVLYSVLGVIVAVLVVALLVWHSGVFQRGATAVSVGGRNYSPTDVEFYYRSALNEEYSSTSGAFDPQSDLRTQYVDEAQTQSYHDKFLQSAIDSLTTVAALENAAQAAGYTMTDDDRASVDANIDSMKQAAGQSGYDYSSYLKAVFGRYMTTGAYKACLERAALINGYAASYQDSLDITDEDLESYYQENAANLDSYRYRSIFIDGSAPSGTDAEGNTVEATDAEKEQAMQAAKAKADALIQAVESSSDKEATFVGLAPDYVLESRKQNYLDDPDYSLTESITGANLTNIYYMYYYGVNYGSWLTEAGRAAGDITAVESSGSGYNVVLFLDRWRDESSTADVRHILVKAALADADDPATEDVNESTVPTQEALDAAKAEAEALLAQWESGDKTAASFGALAQEHSADTGSAAAGGLLEYVYEGQMFPDFNDWCLDPARQEGDTTLIENPQSGQQGWHVVYFQNWEAPLWKATSDTALRGERTNEWMDGLREGLEATQSSGVKYVG